MLLFGNWMAWIQQTGTVNRPSKDELILIYCLQWRNRLAHGTYMTVQLQSNAEVVSSSLTWRILLFRNHLQKQKSKNVERFTILRVILAQGPC